MDGYEGVRPRVGFKPEAVPAPDPPTNEGEGGGDLTRAIFKGTDSHGHFLSHLLSATHRRRVRRAALFPSGDPERHLFFNISAFGKEFHLRLRPNARLVAPGAVVEWHDDSDGNANRTAAERTLRRELLKSDCTFVGDITDVPGASVAINNCDGLNVHKGVSNCSKLPEFWYNAVVHTDVDSSPVCAHSDQQSSTPVSWKSLTSPSVMACAVRSVKKQPPKFNRLQLGSQLPPDGVSDALHDPCAVFT
ncbi:A disintegrin and metalloproteinase with thrombospondin motifs 3 [Liparis tanakae]|uniref:A disintegrin and metalloproteinase with thrombospondin motifs 3 n=1 Tax=Liparis tanakae TaxID=230148 RepID=A0A4Z2FKF9_9TELE|nr:A disintegrin and metalloproteinase with thrombospondin motifs 3 [Liparis tanakae]